MDFNEWWGKNLPSLNENWIPKEIAHKAWDACEKNEKEKVLNDLAYDLMVLFRKYCC